MKSESPPSALPASLFEAGVFKFYLAVIATGIAAGLAAAGLTRLLELVQNAVWAGGGHNILEAAQEAAASWHIYALAGAGILTGIGQLLLVRLTSGNGTDISEAIWFRAGRLPLLRSLASAVLSIFVVGMGASLGREGAPKQFGAVAANFFSDRQKLSDEQRRLLVACGAGAGMAAAYGVPLGGALFALEVLRGVLALRLILPALLASVIATMVSWIALPDAVTYTIPVYTTSTGVIVWSLFAGPLIGLSSVGYVRLMARADRMRPKGGARYFAPLLALTTIGGVSIWFPEILGNGKDIAQLVFTQPLAPLLLLSLVFLKPLSTFLCIGSGTPGGLFTPSLSFGALLGAVLGLAWSWMWPGASPGLFAIIGASAMLAASTQGPISAVVLMMELTGQDRNFIVPMILAVATATLVARTIEPRSIYDARLTDEEVNERMRMRMPAGQT